MSISKQPSKITLPEKAERWTTVYSFLKDKFPHIKASDWRKRISNGKVHWLDGTSVTLNTPFFPGKCVCYYREVASEPKIPFNHWILFQDEHIVVADKPHFLQVTPGGSFVNECLLVRIQQQLKLDDIVPVHRLDRDTAGLVMFSTNPESRAQYFELFAKRRVQKIYQAVAHIPSSVQQQVAPIHWQVANRIEGSNKPRVNRQYTPNCSEQINARSDVTLTRKEKQKGLFKLTPHTGKTHQLRLHMLKLGMPILNDRYYPNLQNREQAEDFNRPLQLLAQSLAFHDPITQYSRSFTSHRTLAFS